MLPAICCDLCPADAADGYDDGETCLCEACCDRLLAGIKPNVEVAAGPEDDPAMEVWDPPRDDDEDDDDPESAPVERDARRPTNSAGRAETWTRS
jgi:hypothetical protein